MRAKIIRPVDFAATEEAFERSREIHEHHGAFQEGPHPDYDDYPDDDCSNCGGEGVTYSCIDGCCEDADEGCELCARSCDWCNPPKPKALPTNEVQALRQVLSDALTSLSPRGGEE